jgi:hypothetical protein
VLYSKLLGCVAVVGVLITGGNALRAEDGAVQPASSETVTISQESYQDILTRLTTLEAIAGSTGMDESDVALKEIELPTKPT